MTPFSKVTEYVDTLKSDDYEYSSVEEANMFVKTGILHTGLKLNREYQVDDENIISEISQNEFTMISLFAYRALAIKTHDTLMRKAINFKTIAFQVSGLTERAKETMRVVWWLDGEIEKCYKSIITGSSFSISGFVKEMEG